MLVLAIDVLAVNALAVNCSLRLPPLHCVKKCRYTLHSVKKYRSPCFSRLEEEYDTAERKAQKGREYQASEKAESRRALALTVTV